MIKVLVKPVTGRVVPYPERGRHLAEAGEEVIINSYWQRRINDGDVIKIKPTKAETKGGK
ncbi:MAG: hypothetical protein [Bacteriophage sp.]|nr:MAG: hypothetical protein [Bacteriophage sp.]